MTSACRPQARNGTAPVSMGRPKAIMVEPYVEQTYWNATLQGEASRDVIHGPAVTPLKRESID